MAKGNDKLLTGAKDYIFGAFAVQPNFGRGSEPICHVLL